MDDCPTLVVISFVVLVRNVRQMESVCPTIMAAALELLPDCICMELLVKNCSNTTQITQCTASALI